MKNWVFNSRPISDDISLSSNAAVLVDGLEDVELFNAQPARHSIRSGANNVTNEDRENCQGTMDCSAGK